MKPGFLIISAVAFFFSLSFSCNEGNYNTKNVNTNGSSPSPSVTIKKTPNPERLIEIILELQDEYVGESFGTEADEGFTDDELNDFKNNGILNKIEKRLREDKNFTAVAEAIKNISPDKQQELLDKARKTYKQTWRQLELNPKRDSKEDLLKGQTDAGQEAEKMIAQKVVHLVNEML